MGRQVLLRAAAGTVGDRTAAPAEHRRDVRVEAPGPAQAGQALAFPGAGDVGHGHLEDRVHFGRADPRPARVESEDGDPQGGAA